MLWEELLWAESTSVSVYALGMDGLTYDKGRGLG